MGLEKTQTVVDPLKKILATVTAMVHGAYNFKWYSTFTEKYNIVDSGSTTSTILSF